MVQTLIYEEYVEILDKGLAYITRRNAESIGLLIPSDAKAVAQLKCHWYDLTGIETEEVEYLYDMTGEFKLIRPAEWINGFYTYRKHLDSLLIDEDDLTEDEYGYVMFDATFFKAVNIERLMPSGLTEVKPMSRKYVALDKIEDIVSAKGIRELKYFVKDQYGVRGVYDRKEIISSLGKKQFKKLDISYPYDSFPFVDSYFFYRFKNGNSFKLYSPSQEFEIAGYTTDFTKVYDVRDVLLAHKQVYTKVGKINKLVAIVPFAEYKKFIDSVPSGYFSYLHLVGMTTNDELIVRGPDRPTWLDICENYKTIL